MWIQEQPTCPATPHQQKHTDRTEPSSKDPEPSFKRYHWLRGPLVIAEQTYNSGNGGLRDRRRIMVFESPPAPPPPPAPKLQNHR